MDTQELVEELKKEWLSPELSRLDLALTKSGGDNSPLEALDGIGELTSS